MLKKTQNLFVFAVFVIYLSPGTGQMPVTEEVFMENILNRTSVREFLPQDIDEAAVEQLLRSAMSAPSAGNRQPWEFVVIRNRDIREALAEQLPYAAMAAAAPVVVAVCADMRRTLPGESAMFWVQDTAAATENLLLSAHALGLGGVWVGIYPVHDRVKTARKILKLPEYSIPLNIVPLGHPAVHNPPKQKFDRSRIHHEEW